MKLLYEAILKAFSAETEAAKNDPANSIFATANLQPPVFIDLYDSQPEIPEDFEFMCPALFLDYSVDWQKNGALRIGTLSLVVHVLTDAMENTSNISGLPDGLKKICYYETVVNVLEGIATEETSGLVLADERPISTDYFNYHQLTFTCTISRKITDTRNYVDGVIEKITIDGNIKQRKTYVLPQ